MKSIGVDVGGTKIKAGLVEGEKIVKKVEIETEAGKGRGKVVQNIIKAVELLGDKKVKTIGVGIPGMLVHKTGEVLICPFIPTLEGHNLKKTLEKKLHKKVILDNDVKTATLAEAKYGAGKGYKHIVMITLGTGIGGGILSNGKFYRGKGNAGEIGHMSINFDGIKSMCCKSYGCFQEYASIRALQRNYGRQTNPKEIAYRAMNGDKKAKQAYEEMGRAVGIGIVNIANLFDPEIIIIGGGIARSYDLFEKEMIKTAKEREMLSAKIAKAKLEEPGIIGAALLTQGGK
jgi:glucokinase